MLIGAFLWLLLPDLASAHALLIPSNLIPGVTISFGRSGTRADLYASAGIDVDSIVAACVAAL